MEFKYICEDYPWMDPPIWTGTIFPLLPFEPADYDVTARGSRFHLIISEHSSGKYKNQYSVLLQTVLANS